MGFAWVTLLCSFMARIGKDGRNSQLVVKGFSCRYIRLFVERLGFPIEIFDSWLLWRCFPHPSSKYSCGQALSPPRKYQAMQTSRFS